MNLPETTKRVTNHTSEQVNRAIRQQVECRIRYFAQHPEEIDTRLSELDREWDIERTLESNASLLAFSGVVLGATVSRKFFWLTAAVTGFLAQHALQGWCPPMPVLRHMGVRTQTEIEAERYALRFLRGDFDKIGRDNGQHNIDQTVETMLQANKRKETEMPAKSKKQQMAAGAALSAKRGEIKERSLKGASKQMVESMTEEQLKELASGSRKGKPEKAKK